MVVALAGFHMLLRAQTIQDACVGFGSIMKLMSLTMALGCFASFASGLKLCLKLPFSFVAIGSIYVVGNLISRMGNKAASELLKEAADPGLK